MLPFLHLFAGSSMLLEGVAMPEIFGTSKIMKKADFYLFDAPKCVHQIVIGSH